ncbi:MAG: nitroreductase family protein [Actinomycetota bacterium]|nr:nitroreductase family protein [Actinomycetota bacterium]
MDLDSSSVDYVLSTTRSVRLRLDFDREVDLQIILDCIDIAEQAPTGGNRGSRRWIVVTEVAEKKKIADLYLKSAGDWIIKAWEKLQGSGHPNERMMQSAAYLAENLAKSPAIVIPVIIGVHDGSGRPGLFDSVIQSAWSFCLALRARGLGTAWTTAILSEQDELKEILGIPEGITEIAMFPVAWTKGTDFSKVSRDPSQEITFFNEYGLTFENSPSNPIAFANGPGVSVEVDIASSLPEVWKVVTDINFPARFSDEFVSAEWNADVIEIGLGAKFTGTNSNGSIGQWTAECTIDAYEVNKVFGWCTGDPSFPGARWRFEIEAFGSSTRLRHKVVLGPGPSGLTRIIEQQPDKEGRIIRNRTISLKENMIRVIEGIKSSLET